MALTNKVVRQVDVRLAGPSTLISALQQKEISAAVDLSGAKGGRETIPLTERSVKVPAGFRVERVYPASVEVVLEKLERRIVPVLPQVGGASKVRARIARTEVDPPSLEGGAPPDEVSRRTPATTDARE